MAALLDASTPTGDRAARGDERRPANDVQAPAGRAGGGDLQQLTRADTRTSRIPMLPASLAFGDGRSDVDGHAWRVDRADSESRFGVCGAADGLARMVVAHLAPAAVVEP